MRAMKMWPGLTVVEVALVGALQAHPAQAREPSTHEERAKVVALTRLLEREPFAENTAATRQWLRAWVMEVPDIRVYVCDALLSDGVGDTYPYSREITSQPMLSAAAFAIEHPDKARDEISQYNGGIEGALRVYEALLKSKPDARSAFLDELVAKRDCGTLVDHIAKTANEKCKRANTDLIASLAGAGVALVLGLIVGRWFPGGRARSGLAAFTVAVGLRGVHQSSWSARLGFGLLVVAAVFVCLAGVFKDFLPHFAASAVTLPSITLAPFLLSWSFRHAGEWHAIHRATLLIALGMLAAFVAMNTHFAMPGLLQRAFIFLFLLWLSVVAHRLTRLKPQE